MPTWIEQTGDSLSCEMHPADFGSAVTRLRNLIGTVLEGPGNEPDRFYMVVGMNGERVGFRATVSLTVVQMREISAPDGYKDWRYVYRSVRLTSPLAARLASAAGAAGAD